MKQQDDFDKFLEDARQSLREKEAPPYLWRNIADKLEKSTPAKRPAFGWLKFPVRLPVLAGVAASALLAALAIYNISFSGALISPQEARHYALEIDRRLYPSLEKYEDKIKLLESAVDEKQLSSTDNDFQSGVEQMLMLDMLIADCKSSLKNNPFSPTIHEKLVFGYRHKLDTLNKILADSEERYV